MSPSHSHRVRYGLSRRSWLKGVSLGAGLSLCGPLLSRIATAQQSAQPRFLFVVEGNGFEPITLLGDSARDALNQTLTTPLAQERWWHQRYTHSQPIEVTGGLTSAPALAGLGALEAQSAVLLGLSAKISGGGHSSMHGVLSSARTIAGSPGGVTIDAYLAELPQVKGIAPYDAVRLGVGTNTARPLDFGTCAYASGRAAPLLLQPTRAYESLFGSVSGGEGMAAFQRQGEHLDFAAEDVRASLNLFSGGSQEREKLETYLASIETIRARRVRLVDIQDQLRGVLPTEPPVAQESALSRFNAQLDLAKISLLGGLSHVCVVGCGTGNDFNLSYPEVITGVSRHDLHHDSALNPSFRDAIHTVTRLQVEAITRLARDLDSTPDLNGGSMLDQTLIVYIGDNGEQHHSTASDLPILLIGGRALGLKTEGRSIIYPGISAGSGHRQISNLWNTLGHLAGAPLNLFGAEGPTRVAEGPLAELIL